MDPVRLAICYELGHRAGLGHDLSPLRDDGLYKKILFLDHRGVEHPKFGHSVALRAMASTQSAPSKHQRRPPRAAGKLFCFELALPKASLNEQAWPLDDALRQQSGESTSREDPAPGAVADGRVAISARVTSTITSTASTVAAASTTTSAVTTVQSSTGTTVHSYKVALVADVLGPAAQGTLKAAGERRLWLGRGALTPLDHVDSGAVHLGASFKPHFFLAACVVIRNARGEVLLTRRAAHMRTFPRCWVFPGGGHDGSEPLETTALREAHEETGLKLEPGQLRRLCLWESAFPTTLQSCIDAGGLKRHQLVVFFVCQLTESQTAEVDARGVTLQEEEVDEAVWLSPHHVELLGDAKIGDVFEHEDDNEVVPSCYCGSGGGGGNGPPPSGSAGVRPMHGVPLKVIRGVYPDPSTGQGCGEGHVFALTVLAHEQHT